jgi:hypothetical protein
MMSISTRPKSGFPVVFLRQIRYSDWFKQLGSGLVLALPYIASKPTSKTNIFIPKTIHVLR